MTGAILRKVKMSVVLPWKLSWNNISFNVDIGAPLENNHQYHIKSPAVKPEIVEWCDEHLGGKRGWNNCIRADSDGRFVLVSFYFRSEEDATMFMLRWCNVR